MTEIWVEIAKTLVPVAAAGTIAWLTARWALGRYKRERAWEQRLAAYTKTVAAIADMVLICELRLRDFETGRSRSADDDQQITGRFQVARLSFDECVAQARIVLPAETRASLIELQHDLETWDADDIHGFYDSLAARLITVRDLVAAQGEAALS